MFIYMVFFYSKLFYKPYFFMKLFSFLIFDIKIKIIFFFMKDTLIEIDLAMNMIKEEISRELCELVTRQAETSHFEDLQPNSKPFSFSAKKKD